ncbi:hypothetical protein C8J56DRAFT_1064847 [Mycena floridula]|nr:hypothetical protein C8J56DRAFT_1064847 [Mycena floridula]
MEAPRMGPNVQSVDIHQWFDGNAVPVGHPEALPPTLRETHRPRSDRRDRRARSRSISR